MSLYREGSFYAPIPNLNGRCGPKGNFTFDFQVLFEAEGHKLTPESYIIDADLIPAYFYWTYTAKPFWRIDVES